MMKKIYLEMDEQLVDDAEKILNDFGMDIQIAVRSFLTRVKNERTLSFLFDRKAQPEKTQKVEQTSSEKQGVKNHIKMTKTLATRLAMKRKNKIGQNVTFASQNSSTDNFWANPKFELLDEDWTLILNDKEAKRLYVFFIPAHSISKRRMISRADMPKLIDLQIMYNDITFTDNRSGVSFAKYLIDNFEY